jgi:hypothetical protein
MSLSHIKKYSTSFYINDTKLKRHISYVIFVTQTQIVVAPGKFFSKCVLTQPWQTRYISEQQHKGGNSIRHLTAITLWQYYRMSHAEPATIACRSSSERPTGKWVSHSAEHSCRIIVRGFRVTWDILYNWMRWNENCTFQYFLKSGSFMEQTTIL